MARFKKGDFIISKDHYNILIKQVTKGFYYVYRYNNLKERIDKSRIHTIRLISIIDELYQLSVSSILKKL